jgi:quercetin dioxygenase-like cupin family protein
MDMLSDAWIEGDEGARWRSGSGSLLEVPPGCRLPRHTDSADERIVVVAGRAEVEVGGQARQVAAGETADVPECVPHEVRNAADEPLRFVALYASTDVVTTYEQPVAPDGERERRPLG